MADTTHERDPNNAADDQGSPGATEDTSDREHSDNKSTLAKVNDQPPAPDDAKTPAGEDSDDVTVFLD